MNRQPQRIIEAAMVESIGPITARELIAMPEDRWGWLRDRITDRRNGKDGVIARCMACESQVFVKTRAIEGTKHPLFQHYNGADRNCPWRHDQNERPDDIRAEQYQGQQESQFHRLMCEEVGKLVSFDVRYVRHTIAEYLPPTQNEHGRFPDVYVEWKEFGPFAVEFQMSNTFQTEISARCKHYEYEAIPLLWVLFGIDAKERLPQNFIDVIRRHRNNAFVVDMAAIEASRAQKTFVLTCYMRNGDGFDPPKLVRFDQLQIPRSKLPFLEDRLVDPLLAEIDERRKPWFDRLKNWNPKEHVGLAANMDRAQSLLVAAAFSIVANANGKERNYASMHPNISAMLNTYLSTEVFAPYATLLRQLIKNTACDYLLDKSVGEHLRRYGSGPQMDQTSPEWKRLSALIPEALEPDVRAMLSDLDALPNWAKSSSSKPHE